MSENQAKRKTRSGGLRVLFVAALFGVLAAVIAISGIAAPSGVQEVAAAPVTVPEFTPGFRIASSSTHTLAVKDGSLYGWGTNYQGQLPGATEKVSEGPVKLAVADVADAAASAGRTLVVLKNGELRVYGVEPSDPTYEKNDGKVLASDAAVVDASDTAAAYISKTGALYTWGLNYEGLLGNKSTETSAAPVQIFESGAKKVVVSDSFMAALMEDGSVYAWGSNSDKQLGSAGDSVSAPVRVATGMADISAGQANLLLLSTNGVLSGCGSNMNGQLGLGGEVLSTGIRQILTGVVGISAGSRHGFAVSGEGTVYSWGSNVSGQLGNGTTQMQMLPNVTGFDFTKVFAGDDRTFAVRSDGKIVSFGDNTNYVLGKTDGSDSLLPLVFLDSEMNWVYEEENPVAGPANLQEYLEQLEGKTPEQAGESESTNEPEQGNAEDHDHEHAAEGPISGESETIETKVKAFISGDGSGNFYPDNNVTRAQFLRMIVYSLYEDFDPEKDYGPSQFSDVADGAWYRNFVAFAEQVGLVHGDEEGHFRPNDPISRGDASVLVSLALQLDTDSAIPSKFPDVNTSRYYSKHIDALTALGILSGDEEGLFNPTKFITRSQAVTVVSRALGFQPDEDTKAALLEQFSESPFEDVRPDVWYYAYLLRGVGAVE